MGNWGILLRHRRRERICGSGKKTGRRCRGFTQIVWLADSRDSSSGWRFFAGGKIRERKGPMKSRTTIYEHDRRGRSPKAIRNFVWKNILFRFASPLIVLIATLVFALGTFAQ